MYLVRNIQSILDRTFSTTERAAFVQPVCCMCAGALWSSWLRSLGVRWSCLCRESGLVASFASNCSGCISLLPSAETRKTPSRPGSRAGSKAGSRSSSRRGSDASDFDISEIQSVCSDVSETVRMASRPTPRPSSRSGSSKPSKIPTPQRRSPASKLDKSSKR